ncbi:hypothetical protein [Mycetocola zhujimingii]|uniref:Uncharacterized protein n=1 Tax=Mycetocola zhujimingii TaxID=2079792 RepID=A0A2U1TGU5_9MICO|nr:hypothetical protein [Mycetocola zhujimingii]PWC08109.1 hypothetical protein DF223_01775 [Mycetocola zhujimingii]
MRLASISEGFGNVLLEAVGWLFPAFLIVVIVALMVRVAIALVRRKPRGIKDAFEPIVRTGRIQSELYGVKTYDDGDLDPKGDNPPHGRT